MGFMDFIQTSPGRVDPRTGELVVSTAVPKGERRGIFDFIETSPGRVDPRTGRMVPRAGDKRPAGSFGRSPERGLSRFGSRSVERPELAPAGEVLSGSGAVGCGTCSEMSGSRDGFPTGILLTILGVSAFVALEAFGITKFSK